MLVDRRARSLNWEINAAIMPMIASRGKGTPRLALRLLQAARRVTRAGGEHRTTVEHLLKACRLEHLDTLGLGPLEQRYLHLLIDGPRRVNVLASSPGVRTKTLSSVTEPFLIRAGLIEKDDQSCRVLTAKGHQHLADSAPYR